ncbi:hypothetical protein P9112_008777 [Eukaryota sp. TZLM1-RC]
MTLCEHCLQELSPLSLVPGSTYSKLIVTTPLQSGSLHLLSSSIILRLEVPLHHYSHLSLSTKLPTVWCLNDIYITFSERLHSEPFTFQKGLSTVDTPFSMFTPGSPKSLSEDRLRLKTLKDYFFPSSLCLFDMSIPPLLKLDICLLLGLYCRGVVDNKAFNLILKVFLNNQIQEISPEIPLFAFNYFGLLLFQDVSQTAVNQYLDKGLISFIKFFCLLSVVDPFDLESLINSTKSFLAVRISKFLQSAHLNSEDFHLINDLLFDFDRSQSVSKSKKSLNFETLPNWISFDITNGKLSIGDVIRIGQQGFFYGKVDSFLSLDSQNFASIVVDDNKFDSRDSRIIASLNDFYFFNMETVLKIKRFHPLLNPPVHLFEEVSKQNDLNFVFGSDDFISKIPGSWINISTLRTKRSSSPLSQVKSNTFLTETQNPTPTPIRSRSPVEKERCSQSNLFTKDSNSFVIYGNN